MIKGLEEYIERHGRHFTEELAYKAAGKKWSAKQVERAAQRRVYYNVTGSTLGDMTYLTNVTSDGWGFKSISKCINYTLFIVGDFRFYDGVLFNQWLCEIMEGKDSFDFTPYI